MSRSHELSEIMGFLERDLLSEARQQVIVKTCLQVDDRLAPLLLFQLAKYHLSTY